MKAIILAAGYATRLYPLTKDKPKALLPIHGRPLIYYLIDQAETLPDLEEIIVVSNHRFVDQFKAWAKEREGRSNQKTTVPLKIIDDGTTCETDRLGAIGDIQFCIDHCHIDDDLLVMAGDNLFTWRLYDAWAHFRKHGEDMIVAHRLEPSQDPRNFAIVVTDPNGLVLHLEEKPENPRSDIAVYAIYFYRKDTLPLFRQYLEEGNNPDAPGHFPAWLYKRKPVRVYFFDGHCFDIGTPEAYQEVLTTFPLSLSEKQDDEQTKV